MINIDSNAPQATRNTSWKQFPKEVIVRYLITRNFAVAGIALHVILGDQNYITGCVARTLRRDSLRNFIQEI